MQPEMPGPDLTRPVLRDLRPGRRFAGVTFAGYLAHPGFPSQQAAALQVQAFVQGLIRPARPAFWRQRPPVRGLYLDGGFGVGKTHLLASAWALAAPDIPAGYVHFQELTSLIGRLGSARAAQVFAQFRLLCIDEFELDDPGNTHLIGTFLGRIMPGGVNVITTSNTPPGSLGEGRFNAALFSETLRTLAARFETVRLDGPDYRGREQPRQTLLSAAEYLAWRQRHEGVPLLSWSGAELADFLMRVHPADFGRWLGGVGGVAVTDLRTFTHPDKLLREQGAVRFVHFVDRLYDLGVPAAFTGVPIAELFEDTYRTAAFGRKYSRCLSRVAELMTEAS
ncbi:cell division protein ZapE [Deinococcus kurensis]|uniref:cell division protein ZapE n=1 Tax=Deinococcus kurensis TaxID=2662757 RepID=UPI0012D32BC8|nr:cell division protein ZapE [Deinococcus kurensis]